MPYLLEDLVIDRVDLVDEGANSASFIQLYKRKERGDKMELQDIIAKMLPEEASVIQTEIDKLAADVAKAAEDLSTATAECEAAKASLVKMEEDLTAANEEMEASKSELETLKGTSFDEEETMKSMPEAAREMFTKMKLQKEAAEEAVLKAKEIEEHATAVAKAASLKALPIEQDKLVGILKGASAELLEALTSINAAVDAAVLGEVGKDRPGSTSVSTSEEAWGQIEAKADEIVKAKGISKAKAISKAVEENADLYKQYLKGGAN